MQIELADLADVIRLVELVDERMNVGQQGHRGNLFAFVGARVLNLPGGGRRPIEGSRKGGCLTLVHPHILLEAQALAIRKEQRFR